MTHIEPAANLFDFFHGRVEEARAGRGISTDTGLYLASLLAERTRTDRPAPPDETFAELHLRHANAPPAKQARAYRELGDRALYLLGYFRDSLERGTVGPDYYAEMGQAAYWRTDRVFKAWFADAFGPVFAELATKFESCVEIVADVREKHENASDDPLVLAQRWMQTGDEKIAEKLRERGLILGPKAEG